MACRAWLPDLTFHDMASKSVAQQKAGANVAPAVALLNSRVSDGCVCIDSESDNGVVLVPVLSSSPALRSTPARRL